MKGPGRDVALAIGVVVLGLLIRLPALAALHAPLAGDEPVYHSTAVLLLKTGRYLSGGEHYNPAIGEPTAFRNPGLPVTLAAVYAVTGTQDPGAGRLAVALLSLLGLPAILWCGTMVFKDRRVGAGAALAVAGSGDLTYASTTLMAEGLAAAMLMTGAALLIQAIRKRSVAVAGAAGAVCGLAVVFRVHILLAVVFVGAAALMRHRVAGLAFLCSAAVLPGAWMARNAVVLGMPTLTTQTVSLWLGHGPFARGGWSGDIPTHLAYMRARYPGFDEMDEVARARLFRREAGRELRAHPLRSLALVPKKLAIALSPWSYLGMDWVFALVFPLALVGMVAGRSSIDRGEFLVLVAPIAGVLATCALVFGEPRFRSVVDPFFALFAAYGALGLADRVRTSRYSVPSARAGSRGHEKIEGSRE